MATKEKQKREPKPKPVAVFITKAELVHHMGVDLDTLDDWIEAGTFPPPHSRPGERVTLWLRKYFDRYVSDGSWPPESFARGGA